MRTSVRTVHELIQNITPFDELEAQDRAHALRWLESTDDVFRRVKPATPAQHLVSYVAVVDAADQSSLLVDHRNARLWLPPGGHVEVDEHPAETARREAWEELGIEAVFAEPTFITVTETVGVDHGHTDVSLWFVLLGRRGMRLVIDPDEFGEARWWTPEEVQAIGPGAFDPQYGRFVAKLTP